MLNSNEAMSIRKKSICELQDLSPTILKREYPGDSIDQLD